MNKRCKGCGAALPVLVGDIFECACGAVFEYVPKHGWLPTPCCLAKNDRGVRKLWRDDEIVPEEGLEGLFVKELNALGTEKGSGAVTPEDVSVALDRVFDSWTANLAARYSKEMVVERDPDDPNRINVTCGPELRATLQNLFPDVDFEEVV